MFRRHIDQTFHREERCKMKLENAEEYEKECEAELRLMKSNLETSIACSTVVDDVDPSIYDEIVEHAKNVCKLASKLQHASLKVALAQRAYTIAQSNSILNPARCLRGDERKKIEDLAQKMVQDAEVTYDANILQITTLYTETIVKYKSIISEYKK